MKDKTKTVKQIVVNVSNESKDRINELKEQMELTDKEMIAVLLNIFDATKTDDVQTIVEKLIINKQKAKIEARLATIQNKLEKVKGELNEVATTEESSVAEEEVVVDTNPSEEEVIYDASLEEELIS